MAKNQTESAGGVGRLAQRGMVRGERDVAGLGLSMLGVIGGVALGAAGLAAIEVERIERGACENHVLWVGQTLAQAAEEMIAEDRLSAVRRMVGESVTSGRLSACRILIAEGEVLASSDPSEINALSLPDRWPSASVTPEAGTEWESATSFPIVIDGRGSLTLEVLGSAGTGSGWTDLVSGIGLIGAGGAAVLWTLYRSMRRRVARLGVVCDAVLALGRGETSTEAVRLSPAYGEVAEAWGRVLEQRATWEEGVAATPLAQVPDRRSSGTSEGLSGAIDAMWHGILLVDKNLNVTYANGAAGLLLEARREEIVGGSIAGRLGSPEVEETVKAVASGTSRRRSGLEVKRGDGRTILRFTVRAVRREDEAAALVVVEDVTQQRAAEEARHSFVAQAAHELRTPLTNIRLYVEQAIEAGDDEVELRSQAMNVINTESQRLERLVQDMLSVAEIESGSLSVHSGDVRLTQLLEELSSDYVAQAREKEIGLKFELPPKLPVIKGDRDKLSLAMHNIVGNALKYTPKGGSVTVKVSWERDEVRIAVEDTGIGIKEAEQTLIFDKFYRAKDARLAEITGTGLGLTLARDVVRLHGGDITLRSELDKGSTFTIALPARAAA